MRKITKSWLSTRGACIHQVESFAKLFPDGMPLTEENVWKCHEAGLDVVWAFCHLMTKVQRQAFLIFSLKQRQPYIATLFRQSGLNARARAIEKLTFNNLDEAIRVFAVAIKSASKVTSLSIFIDTSVAARHASEAARYASLDTSKIPPRGTLFDPSWNAVRGASWDASRDAARTQPTITPAERDIAAKGAIREASRIEQIRWFIKTLITAKGEKS